MNFNLASVILRKPEPEDIDSLYTQKNDVEVANLLGGFSKGYSRNTIRKWIEYHADRQDEQLWIIAEPETNKCLGHVGLYKIDYRIRSAEFAIMLGDKTYWGRGIGKQCTSFVIRYAFQYLNLNRIELSVLSENARAIALYEKLGFVHEGTLRQAQYKHGRFIDVVLMSLLRDEFHAAIE